MLPYDLFSQTTVSDIVWYENDPLLCRMVVCDILSPYPDQGVSFFLGGMVVINICTVIIYLITWIHLRKKGTIGEGEIRYHLLSPISVSSMGRIYRSLFIIMLFDVIGWFLTPSLIVFLRLLHLHGSSHSLLYSRRTIFRSANIYIHLPHYYFHKLFASQQIIHLLLNKVILVIRQWFISTLQLRVQSSNQKMCIPTFPFRNIYYNLSWYRKEQSLKKAQISWIRSPNPILLSPINTTVIQCSCHLAIHANRIHNFIIIRKRWDHGL